MRGWEPGPCPSLCLLSPVTWVPGDKPLPCPGPHWFPWLSSARSGPLLCFFQGPPEDNSCESSQGAGLLEYTLLGPAADLLNQNLWGWGLRICISNILPGHSHL